MTTAIVLSHVGGDLGDDESDVAAVPKLRNGVPEVLTISVDVTPLRFVESVNMAPACGGVVFASPTRCLFSIIDSLPCTNLLRLFFLLRRTSLLHVLGKLTPPLRAIEISLFRAL